MDWDLVIYLFCCGVRVVYFTLEMKELKDNCERFEISPPCHIYSSKFSTLEKDFEKRF